jgi:hypothetical protein
MKIACAIADMPAILESFDWPNLGLFGENLGFTGSS